MKNLYTYVCLFFTSISGLQAQFSLPVMIDSSQFETVTQIACADFNNDGQMDVLTSNFHWDFHIMELHTRTGENTFAHDTVAGIDSLGHIASFATGDINADNWVDFVLVSGNTQDLIWFENEHDGTFTAHPLDTVLEGMSQLVLRDFNNDGMIDLLSLQHFEIVIHFTTTPGNFAARQVIHDGTEFYALDVADYNADGFLDVAVGQGGFDILLNQGGSGDFSLLADQGGLLTFGLKSGDLDHDGDTDIVAYESVAGLVFYANDNSGNFELQHVILPPTDQYKRFGIAHLDCDADLDVYTVSMQQGKLFYLKNDGIGNFSEPQVVHVQVNGQVSECMAADMNADGQPDLLWGGKYVAMHFNHCATLGVATAEDDSDLLLYPNPAQGKVYVENKQLRDVLVRIYEPSGRMIAEIPVSAYGTTECNLPAVGACLLEIRTVDGMFLSCRRVMNVQ
jgi:hypothetical protein